MEDGTWVRVVTYDYVLGIPSWAERDRSMAGQSDGYHEFCAEPRSILYLAPEMAERLLLKRCAHLPQQCHSERDGYVPVMEREKERKHERKKRKATYVERKRRRVPAHRDVGVRVKYA